MVFPAKTDRARILSAAMEQLARDGMEKLSLRSLAASLDLAPNALYRYFASRSQLEAAIAAEITDHLHESCAKQRDARRRSKRFARWSAPTFALRTSRSTFTMCF